MRGIIYKIVDNTNNDVYYGGTYQKLSSRKAGHKRDYNRYKNGKSFYTTAYDIFDRGNFSFEEIYSIENDDLNTLKSSLRILERNYIENNTCVNKVIPGRTKAEYQRYYYHKNKDKINKQRKERRLHKNILSNNNIDNV
tara:strand:+ start:213 stop:629 length:417 start_codon:yes stop_codon:yes gene_type:complete